MWQFQTLGEVLAPKFKDGVRSLFDKDVAHVCLQFAYDEDDTETYKRFCVHYNVDYNEISFDLEWSRMLGDALCFCQYKDPALFGDVFDKVLTVSVVDKY